MPISRFKQPKQRNTQEFLKLKWGEACLIFEKRFSLRPHRARALRRVLRAARRRAEGGRFREEPPNDHGLQRTEAGSVSLDEGGDRVRAFKSSVSVIGDPAEIPQHSPVCANDSGRASCRMSALAFPWHLAPNASDTRWRDRASAPAIPSAPDTCGLALGVLKQSRSEPEESKAGRSPMPGHGRRTTRHNTMHGLMRRGLSARNRAR